MCFAHRVGGGVSRGHAQYARCFCSWHPTFAPGSSKVAGGFLPSLCSFCPEFALTACACSCFWSHTISFAFGVSRRGVSRCKHWAEDPKAQTCLMSMWMTNKPKHILFPSRHFLMLANHSRWYQWHYGKGKIGQPTLPFLSVSLLNSQLKVECGISTVLVRTKYICMHELQNMSCVLSVIQHLS